MKKINSIIVFTLVTILIISCASAGKMFNYQNRTQLVVGETTLNQAIQYIGKPDSQETKSNKDGDFTIIKYSYAYAKQSGVSVRLLWMEFKNDTLNAKIFNSGFKEDNTDFNYDSYKKIKVNESTKQDVLTIIGEPTGIANCPSSLLDFSTKCASATNVWFWLYTSKSIGLNNVTQTMKTKSLKISFDKNGVVTDIDASEGK